VADGLISTHALSLRDPVIEHFYGEWFSASGALHIRGYLRRKLGGEVGGLVAR